MLKHCLLVVKNTQADSERQEESREDGLPEWSLDTFGAKSRATLSAKTCSAFLPVNDLQVGNLIKVHISRS